MSVQEIISKIKGALKHDKVFFPLLALTLSGASFALGHGTISAGKPDQVTRIPYTQATTTARTDFSTSTAQEGTGIASTTKTQTLAATSSATKVYVASKKGKKYHLPTCPGARTISTQNKIWFATKEEAAQNGYTPASNCKGI